MNGDDLPFLRSLTKTFIDTDPTDVVLIPVEEKVLPSGSKQVVDLPPRPAQRVKLIQLSSDQRPTITVNGVERIIDYHLLAAHDATVRPGDHWSDPDGTTYHVIALSDGYGYMVKAMVQRRVPKVVGI